MKNFLFSTGIIFTVTTVSLAILYFVMPPYYEQVKTKEVRENFSEIIKKVDNQALQQIKNEIDQQLVKGKEEITLFLATEQGKLIYPAGNEGIFSDVFVGIGDNFPDTTESDNSLNVQLGTNSHTIINPMKQKITDAQGVSYNLVGIFSLQPVSDASKILLQIYPFLLVIDFLIGGVAAYLYSRFSTKRIKKLSQTTNKMLSLDHNIKCDITGKDELTMLAKDINYLDEKLLMTIDALKIEVTKTEEVERSKAEFMRISSHELKTPVASLMGIIDGMIYNVGKFKDREFYLSVCKDILQKQAEMIQSILTVSKLDMISLEDKPIELFSLKDVVVDKLKTYQLLAEVNHLEVITYLDDDCMIEGNKEELTRAIDNLLSNAFRYTFPKGKIIIALNKTSFSLKNDALKLLTENELSQVFEPFYRPDFSRNKVEGGTGLGLFIVKQILDRQKFAFRFEKEGKQMCFSIYFPTQ